MIYIFACPLEHGAYEVDETTFKKFLTPKLRKELEARRHLPVAELVFKKFCPKCKPDGKTHVELHVHRARG